MDSFFIWYGLTVVLFFLPALLGIFVFRQRPVHLRHRDSGLPKVGRLGWSWTYLYFGWLVPMFRGEIGMALLHLLFSLFTFGIFQLIWSFLYNKQHLTRLMTAGWLLDANADGYAEMRSRLGIV